MSTPTQQQASQSGTSVSNGTPNLPHNQSSRPAQYNVHDANKVSPMVFVRLRWALTMSALHLSPWQVVGYVFAALMAVGCVVGAAIGGFAIGFAQDYGLYDWLPALMPIIGTLVILTTALMQATVLGENSTMSMGKFVSYGVSDVRLQWGLLLAGLSGLPAITAVISLSVWSMAYRGLGPIAVIMQIVASLCIVVTAMSLSKAVLAAFDVLVRSQAGRSAFYIIIFILIMFGAQLPNILMMNNVSISLGAIEPVAAIVGWTPLGAPFMIPFDAAAGHWLLVIARMAIALALCILCFFVSMWSVRYRRTHIADEGQRHTTNGIGIFGRVPDTPSGAISARILSLLRRDPRQSMMFIFPIFFVVIFALQRGDDSSIVVWVGVLIAGMFMSASEADGLAYDGQAFAMEVIAGTRTIDDRIGRVRPHIMITTVYFILLMIAGFVITGDWHTAQGLMLGTAITIIGLSWSFAGLGVAEVFNCTLMYPVASMEKPFTNPQGRTAAQAFIPMLYMLASACSMLPTGIVTLVLALTHQDAIIPAVLIPVALANGIGILVLGTWLGGKLLHARMLRVLHTLEKFAALQQ